ncbi:hypothetical protein DFH09DRAFT_1216091, partial [Mycena vulgaris]
MAQKNPALAHHTSSRSRKASNRLLDGTNGEKPDATHRALIEETQARIESAAAILELNKSIEDLSYLLPDSIKEATQDDEIYRVITTIQGHEEGNTADSTFNRRFDILFKEDAQCRDANGRLHFIRRGKFGMLMVTRYVKSINWNAEFGRCAAETAAHRERDGDNLRCRRAHSPEDRRRGP